MTPPTVTLLASLDPLVRERAVATARAGDEGLVVLRHELTMLDVDGCVHRVVERDGEVEDLALRVGERCCLSCLLREDTEVALADLHGRRVLLVLPPSAEPAAVAVALVEVGVAHLQSIAAALDPHLTEARLLSGDGMAVIEDLGEDPRSLGEVLARQLEAADLVLHDGAEARSAAIIDALAGPVPQHHLDDPTWPVAVRHDHAALLARLQAGVPRCRSSVRRDGVEQRCWHRRRPLHPGRLLGLLDGDGLAGLLRACGWLWVATRPGTVLELEAGPSSYELAAVDAWLDAVDDHRPAHPARRRQAEQRWDPYYGDRAQDLVLTTLDRDLDELVAALDACLLTDAELATGPEVWRTWPDPFTPWLGDEAELLPTTPEDPR